MNNKTSNINVHVPDEFIDICDMLSLTPNDVIDLFICNLTASEGSTQEGRENARHYAKNTFDAPKGKGWDWLDELEEIKKKSVHDELGILIWKRERFLELWRKKHGLKQSDLE